MFILKTSLSLLLFFVFIIYFTIRKVNPLCEKIIYTRKKVGGRPTSPAESRVSLSGCILSHHQVTRFGISDSHGFARRKAPLLTMHYVYITFQAGRPLGRPLRATSHELRTTKKALEFSSAFFTRISGFLSSQGASPQVLSAFAGLTAVFGMGTGGSPQLSPLNCYVVQDSYPDNCIKMFFLTNSLLVSESSFSLCICFQFHSFLRFRVSDSLSFARRLRLLQNWFSA